VGTEVGCDATTVLDNVLATVVRAQADVERIVITRGNAALAREEAVCNASQPGKRGCLQDRAIKSILVHAMPFVDSTERARQPAGELKANITLGGL